MRAYFFERFTAHVERDATNYPVHVGILIEQTNQRGPASSELRLFASDEELIFSSAVFTNGLKRVCSFALGRVLISSF